MSGSFTSSAFVSRQVDGQQQQHLHSLPVQQHTAVSGAKLNLSTLRATTRRSSSSFRLEDEWKLTEDLYCILGVDEMASQVDIDTAYFLHTSQGERTPIASEAYRVLGHAGRRSTYDMGRKLRRAMWSRWEVHDAILDAVFGHRSSGNARLASDNQGGNNIEAVPSMPDVEENDSDPSHLAGQKHADWFWHRPDVLQARWELCQALPADFPSRTIVGHGILSALHRVSGQNQAHVQPANLESLCDTNYERHSVDASKEGIEEHIPKNNAGKANPWNTFLDALSSLPEINANEAPDDFGECEIPSDPSVKVVDGILLRSPDQPLSISTMTEAEDIAEESFETSLYLNPDGGGPDYLDLINDQSWSHGDAHLDAFLGAVDDDDVDAIIKHRDAVTTKSSTQCSASKYEEGSAGSYFPSRPVGTGAPQSPEDERQQTFCVALHLNPFGGGKDYLDILNVQGDRVVEPEALLEALEVGEVSRDIDAAFLAESTSAGVLLHDNLQRCPDREQLTSSNVAAAPFAASGEIPQRSSEGNEAGNMAPMANEKFAYDPNATELGDTGRQRISADKSFASSENRQYTRGRDEAEDLAPMENDESTTFAAEAGATPGASRPLEKLENSLGSLSVRPSLASALDAYPGVPSVNKTLEASAEESHLQLDVSSTEATLTGEGSGSTALQLFEERKLLSVNEKTSLRLGVSDEHLHVLNSTKWLNTVKPHLQVVVPNVTDEQIPALRKLWSGGLLPTASAYTLLIAAASNANLLSMTLRLFADMRASGLQPGEATYNYALMAAAKESAADVALQLLKNMKDSTVCRPNDISYSLCISSLGRSGRAMDGLALFTEMQREGILPTAQNYHNLLDSCGEGIPPDDLAVIINEMEGMGFLRESDRLILDSGSRACDSSVDKLIGGIEFQADELEAAEVGLQLFMLDNELSTWKLPQNVSVASDSDNASSFLPHYDTQKSDPARKKSAACDSVTNVVARKCREEGSKLRLGGLLPSATVYTLLVAAASKSENMLPMATKLIAEMKSEGLQPGELTYNYALTAAAKAAAADTALQLLQGMKDSDVCKPNALSFGLCISALGRSGRGVEGLTRFREMQKEGIKPSSQSYHILVDTCRGGMSAEELAEVLVEMKRAGALREVDRSMLGSVLSYEDEEVHEVPYLISCDAADNGQDQADGIIASEEIGVFLGSRRGVSGRSVGSLLGAGVSTSTLDSSEQHPALHHDGDDKGMAVRPSAPEITRDNADGYGVETTKRLLATSTTDYEDISILDGPPCEVDREHIDSATRVYMDEAAASVGQAPVDGLTHVGEDYRDRSRDELNVTSNVVPAQNPQVCGQHSSESLLLPQSGAYSTDDEVIYDGHGDELFDTDSRLSADIQGSSDTSSLWDTGFGFLRSAANLLRLSLRPSTDEDPDDVLSTTSARAITVELGQAAEETEILSHPGNVEAAQAGAPASVYDQSSMSRQVRPEAALQGADLKSPGSLGSSKGRSSAHKSSLVHIPSRAASHSPGADYLKQLETVGISQQLQLSSSCTGGSTQRAAYLDLLCSEGSLADSEYEGRCYLDLVNDADQHRDVIPNGVAGIASHARKMYASEHGFATGSWTDILPKSPPEYSRTDKKHAVIVKGVGINYSPEATSTHTRDFLSQVDTHAKGYRHLSCDSECVQSDSATGVAHTTREYLDLLSPEGVFASELEIEAALLALDDVQIAGTDADGGISVALSTYIGEPATSELESAESKTVLPESSSVPKSPCCSKSPQDTQAGGHLEYLKFLSRLAPRVVAGGEASDENCGKSTGSAISVPVAQQKSEGPATSRWTDGRSAENFERYSEDDSAPSPLTLGRGEPKGISDADSRHGVLLDSLLSSSTHINIGNQDRSSDRASAVHDQYSNRDYDDFLSDIGGEIEDLDPYEAALLLEKFQASGIDQALEADVPAGAVLESSTGRERHPRELDAAVEVETSSEHFEMDENGSKLLSESSQVAAAPSPLDDPILFTATELASVAVTADAPHEFIDTSPSESLSISIHDAAQSGTDCRTPLRWTELASAPDIHAREDMNLDASVWASFAKSDKIQQGTSRGRNSFVEAHQQHRARCYMDFLSASEEEVNYTDSAEPSPCALELVHAAGKDAAVHVHISTDTIPKSSLGPMRALAELDVARDPGSVVENRKANRMQGARNYMDFLSYCDDNVNHPPAPHAPNTRRAAMENKQCLTGIVEGVVQNTTSWLQESPGGLAAREVEWTSENLDSKSLTSHSVSAYLQALESGTDLAAPTAPDEDDYRDPNSPAVEDLTRGLPDHSPVLPRPVPPISSVKPGHEVQPLPPAENSSAHAYPGRLPRRWHAKAQPGNVDPPPSSSANPPSGDQQRDETLQVDLRNKKPGHTNFARTSWWHFWPGNSNRMRSTDGGTRGDRINTDEGTARDVSDLFMEVDKIADDLAPAEAALLNLEGILEEGDEQTTIRTPEPVSESAADVRTNYQSDYLHSRPTTDILPTRYSTHSSVGTSIRHESHVSQTEVARDGTLYFPESEEVLLSTPPSAPSWTPVSGNIPLQDPDLKPLPRMKRRDCADDVKSSSIHWSSGKLETRTDKSAADAMPGHVETMAASEQPLLMCEREENRGMPGYTGPSAGNSTKMCGFGAAGQFDLLRDSDIDGDDVIVLPEAALLTIEKEQRGGNTNLATDLNFLGAEGDYDLLQDLDLDGDDLRLSEAALLALEEEQADGVTKLATTGWPGAGGSQKKPSRAEFTTRKTGTAMQSKDVPASSSGTRMQQVAKVHGIHDKSTAHGEPLIAPAKVESPAAMRFSLPSIEAKDHVVAEGSKTRTSSETPQPPQQMSDEAVNYVTSGEDRTQTVERSASPASDEGAIQGDGASAGDQDSKSSKARAEEGLKSSWASFLAADGAQEGMQLNEKGLDGISSPSYSSIVLAGDPELGSAIPVDLDFREESQSFISEKPCGSEKNGIIAGSNEHGVIARSSVPFPQGDLDTCELQSSSSIPVLSEDGMFLSSEELVMEEARPIATSQGRTSLPARSGARKSLLVAPSSMLAGQISFSSAGSSRWSIPFITALCSALSVCYPESMQWAASPAVTSLALVAISSSTGALTRPEDMLKAINPRKGGSILPSLASNFLLAPLVAAAVSQVLSLPADFAAGLLLVAVANTAGIAPYISSACGGSQSSSISLIFSCSSVIASATLLPILRRCWSSNLGAGVASLSSPHLAMIMMASTLKLSLLPAAIAMWCSKTRYLKQNYEYLAGGAAAARTTGLAACAILALHGGLLVGQSFPQVLTTGWRLHAAVVLILGSSSSAGFIGAKMLGASPSASRAAAVDGALKSGAFALALGKLLFGSTVSDLPAVVSVMWSGVLGSFLAACWSVENEQGGVDDSDADGKMVAQAEKSQVSEGSNDKLTAPAKKSKGFRKRFRALVVRIIGILSHPAG